jgi:hypothetical protein
MSNINFSPARIYYLAPIFLLLLSVNASSQEHSQEVIRSNELAPEVYADRLQMKITLVNLPGAGDPRSSWEGSCQLYFIPESVWTGAIRSLPPGGSHLKPELFKDKIQLASTDFKKVGLSTLGDRTQILNNIPFKSKIPNNYQTKLARIMSSCSIKIYDAKLDMPVLHVGVFNTRPFRTDENSPGRLYPRTNIYVNFFVTPKGELLRSQLPRDGDSVEWQ